MGEESEESINDDLINYVADLGEDEAANTHNDVNKQVEQFNKSLKEEKMVERLEKFMNESLIVLDPEKKFFAYLQKKEYFALFCSLIAKPHQYQSVATVNFHNKHSGCLRNT
jgi:exopolysaccharide biosynthesis protein